MGGTWAHSDRRLDDKTQLIGVIFTASGVFLADKHLPQDGGFLAVEEHRQWLSGFFTGRFSVVGHNAIRRWSRELMAHFGAERRRTPRVEPVGEHTLALDVSMPAEVVDISLTGIQLMSKAELNVGDRAELRAT